MPVPAAAPRPNARTYAEGKLDFPPIPPRIGPAPLSLRHPRTPVKKGLRKLHVSPSPSSTFPAGIASLSRRERTRSGNMRTEERQETVYALRQGGSTWAVRPWFVWLFADALKCRRWCYGATDGINSFSRLAALGPDSSNGR